MSIRKALAWAATVAFVSTAVASAPAFAQDYEEQDDASLWVAGLGITGAAILGIILATDNGEDEEENPPISP
jgi:hypothetical protein